jgi:hypothetical protein
MVLFVPLQLQAQQGQPMSKIRLIQSMQLVGYAKVALIMKELLMWQGLNKAELLEFIINLKKRPQLLNEFPNPSAEIILVSLKKMNLSPDNDPEIVEFLKDMVGLGGRNAHNRHELIYYLGLNKLWTPADIELLLSLIILAEANGGKERLDGLYPVLRDLKDFATKEQLNRAISVLTMTKFNSISRSLILFRAGYRPRNEVWRLLQLFVDDYANSLTGRIKNHIAIDYGDYDQALSDLSRIYFDDKKDLGKDLRNLVSKNMSYLKSISRSDFSGYNNYRHEALTKFSLGHFEFQEKVSSFISCQEAFGYGDF